MFTTIRIIFSAIVLSLLVFLSVTPQAKLSGLPWSFTPSGYVVHLVSGALVSLVAWMWLRSRLNRWAYLASSTASLLAASAVELVQIALPHRGAQISDLEPAIVGSLLTVSALFVASKVMAAKRHRR